MKSPQPEKSRRPFLCIRVCLAMLALSAVVAVPGQDASDPGPPPRLDGGLPDEEPGFDPPPFGTDGFQPPPPGMMQSELKIRKQFDANGDKWLNAVERKAARASLTERRKRQPVRGMNGPRPGAGPQGRNQEAPKAGAKLSVADVKSFANAPLYASNVLRTLFLEFEESDWEKELEDFHGTDVEVPAQLTVDGKAYPGVGVHFHGVSSYMMVGQGRKRSLVLTLDMVAPDQQLGGYRKLNLLNSHEDPSFLHSVLALQIARDYLPAPQANFVRVVINGESWGVYVNQQHFNKDFLRDWYGTTQGARWKVPGSPNGQGGLNYLGEEDTAYKRIYEIKSKDDPRAWTDLIHLCKVLNQSPSNQLERALSPLLDVDGVLRFLAWENVLANGDGFYTRASDYCLYEDPNGRFHVIPYDANETFSSGGGPGGPGGLGGPNGPGGFRRAGVPGPGLILAGQLLAQADTNKDGKLTQAELVAQAGVWFDGSGADSKDKLTLAEFAARTGTMFPPPPGLGQSVPPEATRGGFMPVLPLGSLLFRATDTNADGVLTRVELESTFAGWFARWDNDRIGLLSETQIRDGLNAMLPRPGFGGPNGERRPRGPGGVDGTRGPGGLGGPGGPGGGGAKLNPLVAANDSSKPLLSKLLAVPSLRARYLGYVHNMAERWLDWERLGPVALRYQALIADEVKADTRKLDSFEEFQMSVAGEIRAAEVREPGLRTSLKAFAEQRRKYLLSSPDILGGAAKDNGRP